VTFEADRDSPDGRKRLIKASMALFAEKGFDGVSVRDIAKESGVSIGLITHHFGSKEGLRAAVDEYFMEQFREALTDDVPRGSGNLESFSAWIDNWNQRHGAEWRVTGKYLRRALLDGDEWGAELFQRYYEFVQSWIVKADARGEIRADVDRLWLPFLIIFLELGTTLLDPYIRRVLGRSGFDDKLWRRQHRAYTNLIFRGIAPPARANDN
jgi:AcrR family transcriptional regulator